MGIAMQADVSGFDRDCTISIEGAAVAESSRHDGGPGRKGPLPVEVVSEGPHCVPCEYAIAAVEYVAEFYAGRIEVIVLETKRKADALRFLQLSKEHGGRLPVPAILFAGSLVFEDIPGPEELSRALDEALLDWERER
jgi:thiol-disulfide isomerase/thioredoxin